MFDIVTIFLILFARLPISSLFCYLNVIFLFTSVVHRNMITNTPKVDFAREKIAE